MGRLSHMARRQGWEVPVTSFVCAIVTLPIILTLVGAFWQDGPSLEHVRFVFGDLGWTWRLVRNSVALVFLTTILCMGVAIPLGFLMFRTKLPGHRLLMAMTLMAAAVPTYVVVGGWAALIGNDAWSRMDHWWQKVLVAGVIQAIAWFPWAALLSGVAFRATDVTREEQGLLDAGVGRLFFKVCISDAFRGLAAVALLIAALSLADVTITDCIRLNTLQQECYLQFRLPDLSRGGDGLVLPKRAAAVAIPYIALILALGLALFGRLGRQGTRSDHATDADTRLFPLRGVSGTGCILLAWALPLLVFGLPLCRLIALVGSWQILVNTWQSIFRETTVSVLCAVAAAIVTTGLGCSMAMVAVRRDGWSWFARALIVLLLAMPAPLVGIAIAMNLNNDLLGWFYDHPAIYVYGMLLRTLPFASLIMMPEIARLPKVLREQTVLDGCSRIRYATSIVLPNLSRGLAMSFLVCMVLNVGELGCSVIIQSPGYATLSIRFFTMIHNGMDAGAAALALAVLFTITLPAGILVILLRRFLVSKHKTPT